MQSIGNIAYVTGGGVNGIRAYDLCTGDQIGNTVCPTIQSWELDYNPDTDLFTWGGQGGIYTATSQELDDLVATGGCFGAPLIPPSAGPNFYTPGDNFIISTTNFNDFFGGNLCTTWGVTSDNAGNIYAVQSCVDGAYTKIVKWDANGNFVTQTPVGTTANDAGYAGALDIRYHGDTDKLYISNWPASSDCVSGWDPGLTSYMTAVPPNGQVGFEAGKAVNIVTECCPTSSSISVDIMLCAVTVGDDIFLQDLLNCEGSICEGLWSVAPGNTGMSFNDCNSSVTIDQTTGCGIFTMDSDGSGQKQCGAFSITINICFSSPNEPAIAVTENDCDAGTTGQFTIVTDCNAGSSMEWSTDNGVTWSSMIPVYDDANAMTVIARCVADNDADA